MAIRDGIGGGLLGQGFTPNANTGGGVLGGLDQFFQNNPQLVSALAAGFLNPQGRGSAGALASAFGGIGPAMAADKTGVQARARQAALAKWFEQQKKAGAIPAATADLAALYPEQYAEQQFAKSTSGRAIKNDANGIPRYVDTGEVVFGADANPQGGGGMFGGKSVEGQGLNYSIDKGRLTKEQAADWAAGKPITGPDGSIYYVTPQSVFGQQGNAPPGSGGAAAGGPPGAFQITGSKSYGSEDQTKAAGFANRVATSDELISKFEDTEGTPGIWDANAAGLPIVGNFVISDKFRQLDQAERDFVNAVLRRESGAAISESEFQNARVQYFPQPGDDRGTVQQKKINRQNSLASLRRGAGPLNRDAGIQAPRQPPPASVSAPAGVDPAVWNVMTPEEKALFK